VYYLRKKILQDERASRTTQFQTRSRIIRRKTKQSKQQMQTKKRQRRRRKIQFENRWRRKKHKIYIVISFEILTIMSAMFRHVAYWSLNMICFQHNVRNKLMFIFYMIFSKLIFVNDLKNSTIIIKQDIVKLFCKINNKQMNISSSNAFYVFECFFNLINFDQLNDLCLITYKFKMFIVENQNITTRKRVNNVFFLSCESM
jgi:hypothetical protein